MDAVSVALLNKLLKERISERSLIAATFTSTVVEQKGLDPFRFLDNLNATGLFLYYFLGPDFENYRDLEKMSDVCNIEEAIELVISSSEMLDLILNSPKAMNVVANSETAMNVVVGSEIAMNAVVNSEIAMNVVVNSGIARSAYLDSTTGRAFYLGSPYALSLIWASTTNSSEVWDRFDNISAVTKGTSSPAGGTYVYKSSGSGESFDITIAIPIDWTHVSQLSLQRHASPSLSVLGIDVLIGSTTIGSFRSWSGWIRSTFDVESYTGVQDLRLRFYHSSTGSNRTVGVGDITFTLTS